MVLSLPDENTGPKVTLPRGQTEIADFGEVGNASANIPQVT